MTVTWEFGTASRACEEGETVETSLQDPMQEATKTCPCCGARLFSDMQVCYECLYDFSRTEPSVGLPSCDLDDLDEPYGDDGLPMTLSPEDTLGLPAPDLRLSEKNGASRQVLRLLVRGQAVDFSLPLGEGWLVVGRSSDCDVVLHSAAVSRRHVRFRQAGEGACVEDLGATNPALLGARPLEGRSPLLPGDTVDVCGTRFTLVGA